MHGAAAPTRELQARRDPGLVNCGSHRFRRRGTARSRTQHPHRMVGAHAQDRHLHCRRAPPPPPHQLTPIHQCMQNSRAPRARSPRSPRPPLHRADRKNDLRALRDLLPRAPLVGRRAAGRHAQDGEAPAAHGAEVHQNKRLRDRAEVGRRRLELAVDPQGGRGQGLLPRQLVGSDALPRRGDVREELRARGRRRGVREHVRDQGVGRRAQARLRHAGAPQFVGAKIPRRNSPARAQLALTLAFAVARAGCLLEEHRLAHVPARRRRDVQALQAEERRVLLRRRRLEAAVRPQRRAPLQHARGLFPP